MSKVIAKRRRARPLDRPERRALLLTCALRVFARRGLGGARHSEIAREAKVSIPTVFVYFPSREVLVREVLAEVARFFLEMTQRIHNTGRPAPEIVIEHGRVFADAMVTHPDHVRILLEWSTALRDEVWPLYLQFHERNLRIIAQTIRKWRRETGRDHDDDAEDSARVIAATGYVVAQMKIVGTPGAKIDHFLHILVRDTLGPAEESTSDGESIVPRTGTDN